MKKASVGPFIFFVVLTAFRPLEAQGFRNFDLGARAATLGGAFVARADDVSAIFYNPAGLAFLPGLRFKTNLLYIEPTNNADVPGYDASYESKIVQFRGSHYLAVNIKGWFAIGIGGFGANTLKTDWIVNWPGQNQSISSRMNSAYFRPAVALKISKNLAVGAGVDFISARQHWSYRKAFTFEETSPGLVVPSLNITNVKGKGVGFTAGLLYRLGDRFGIGGKYTSRVRIDLEGATDFDNPDPYTPFLSQALATNATMSMPQELVVGVMYSALENLSLQLDFQRTGMQDVMNWVFDIDPRIYDDLEDLTGFRPDEDVMGAGLEFKNSNKIMFGIEYILGNSVGLRAGYSRQGSVVKDDMFHPVFPDLGTQIFSLGFGYEGPLFDFYNEDEKIGGLSVDICIQYGSSPGGTSRYLEFPASYRASRWNLGVGVGFVY